MVMREATEERSEKIPENFSVFVLKISAEKIIAKMIAAKTIFLLERVNIAVTKIDIKTASQAP